MRDAGASEGAFQHGIPVEEDVGGDDAERTWSGRPEDGYGGAGPPAALEERGPTRRCRSAGLRYRMAHASTRPASTPAPSKTRTE